MIPAHNPASCHRPHERSAARRFQGAAAAITAALATLLFGACQHTTPAAATAPPTMAAAPAQEQAIRVIVKFKQAVAYSDPSFLGSLSREISAQISYLASISPDTHTYLVIPQGNQGITEILSRLSQHPSVAWAEEDRKVRPSR